MWADRHRDGGGPAKVHMPAGLLSAIVRLAAHDSEIVAVHLFGSRARGDHRPDSDADIALETAGESDGERLANYMLLRTKADWGALGAPFGVDLDVDHYERGSGGIVAPAVEDHGIELYRRP